MDSILKAKKVYLVGIKGVGMTALAEILNGLGIKVVGSDTKEKFFTDKVLKKNKIYFYEGFKRNNLTKELPLDLIISSVAYFTPNKESANPEVKLAQKLKIPILTYPQALAQIFNQSFGIAICGSHGKSSTTAILGTIFKNLNLDPTVLVGSEVIEWKGNSLISKNFNKKIKFLQKNNKYLNNLKWLRKNFKKLPIFIIEADEYRDAFLNYFPRIIIITNIDYDHPDYFPSVNVYQNSFLKFINNLQSPKILIVYKSDLNKTKISSTIKKISITFDKKISFPFPLPGIHFQKNIQLIYPLIKIFNLSERSFKESLQNYKGIKRRFEVIKHLKDIYLIDDYAHHPTEVISFFKSLKIAFTDYKIYFIFQPHTYTRTHFLFKEFQRVLEKIKQDPLTSLIILKTFASAREKENLLLIKNLKKDIDLAKNIKSLFYENDKKLIKFLKTRLKPHTVITTVGAGDAYKILEKIKFYLK